MADGRDESVSARYRDARWYRFGETGTIDFGELPPHASLLLAAEAGPV